MALPALAIPIIEGVAGAATAGASIYAATRGQPKAPTPPKPPSQDTAANAAAQQQQLLARRRGVLSNIVGQNNTGVATPSSGALGD